METPSFYAVIPAPVRYADISPSAKLLYGELSCLTKQEGFCWCSNGYLAKLYNSGVRSVVRWIAELEAAGFIEVEPALNQHGQRRIFVADAAPNLARQKWHAKNGAQKKTREENNTRDIKPPVSPTEGFDAWWEKYGRKGSRRQAEDQWKRLKLTPIAEQVMAGTDRYLASRRVRNGYKQDGFRWLRDRGWEADWDGASVTRPETPMSEVPF